MPERYLVTGGCGFIGSHLVDALLEAGNTVTVLDDLSTGRLDNMDSRAEVSVGDVRDRAALDRASQGCAGIFHLAAVASVPKCTQQWCLSHGVNLSASIGLFELAAERGLPVVYASSSAVYGDSETMPIGEDSPKRPISAYGADKYAMELHAFAGARTRGLRSFGLRFFNIYGPRQDPHSPYSGVIAIFMQNIANGRPIALHGDGAQVRDFVFVTDAVQAMRLAMERLRRSPDPVAQVANVCTGVPTSIRTLGETIVQVMGVDAATEAVPPRAGDILMSIGDPSVLESTLGFRPSKMLSDGLSEMLVRSQDPATQKRAAGAS